MNKKEYLLLLGAIWAAPRAPYWIGCTAAMAVLVWSLSDGWNGGRQ